MMMTWSNWLDDLGGAFGIRRKKSLTEKAVDAVQDFYETAVDAVSDAVSPVLAKPARLAEPAKLAAAGAVTPVLAKSGKMAEKAWERTTDRAESGLEAVSGAAAATAATGAAAAGAVGGFFGAIFSFSWRLLTFALKTAILVGVAYAGWQWLQSRQNNDFGGSYGPTSSAGSTGTTGSTSYTSTYGTVSPTPATVGS